LIYFLDLIFSVPYLVSNDRRFGVEGRSNGSLFSDFSGVRDAFFPDFWHDFLEKGVEIHRYRVPLVYPESVVRIKHIR